MTVDDRVAALQVRMEERFDRLDEKFDNRVGKLERNQTVVHTIVASMGALITFFGWDHIKPWLLTLIKS